MRASVRHPQGAVSKSWLMSSDRELMTTAVSKKRSSSLKLKYRLVRLLHDVINSAKEDPRCGQKLWVECDVIALGFG